MTPFSNIRDYETMPAENNRPIVCGRSLIACQNCASAKTGCDKRLPCSRCAEKNLRCIARYARRATKAAIRATKPMSTHQGMAFKDICGKQIQQASPVLLSKSNIDTAVQHSSPSFNEYPVLQASFALHDQDPSASTGFFMDLQTPENAAHCFGALSPFGTENSLSDSLSTPMSFLTPMSLDFPNHDQVSEMSEVQGLKLLGIDDVSSLSSQIATPPMRYTQINYAGNAERDGIQALSDTKINNTSDNLFSGLANAIFSRESLPFHEEFKVWQAMTSIRELRQTGMLEQPPISTTNDSIDLDQQWRLWSQDESRNRLVYSWVAIDQESSLFHDTTPMLSIDDLGRFLPSPEILWVSESSGQWRINMEILQGNNTGNSRQSRSSRFITPSLNQLFKSFVHQEPSQILPGYLRPLLYPLQSIVCNLNQLLSCFHDSSSPAESNTVSTIKEVQGLLDKWHTLATASRATTANDHEISVALILYHLLYLNTLTNFPQIERLACREHPGSYPAQNCPQTITCVYTRQDVILHCGQVFRLVRSMSVDSRPSWWVRAVYRAVLILWSDAILRPDSTSKTQANTSDLTALFDLVKASATSSSADVPVISIDQIASDSPIFKSPTWSNTSTPVLTRQDGSTIGLHNPTDILQYGIHLVNEGPATSIGDEVKVKLMTCCSRWGGDVE
ncbi:Transcription factor [Cladobotryum mycophilum]|uniref:Transcription factor n=1 Tax=Cladobotryum mycophilum TaxID=491253 RepID=A0ABR0S6L9_9HYPO